MKYYITTPIYYINDKPHIGSAYTTIAADTLARYHRLKGDEVFFLIGVDENAQKNSDAAIAAGKGDAIQEYLDEQTAVWRATWEALDISATDFIRTTENRHKKGVNEFWKRVQEKGDIYKGTYTGYYCVGCEAFIRETDLVEGLCPDHKKKPEKIEEENYFFKCSAYRDQLLGYIEKHPDFIQPQSRKNEIIQYIKDHFEDISISRQSLKWGIPVPGDPTHVVYVWFDALINYLTGVGFGDTERGDVFEKWWPADLHLVGKDIIKFHCALWPAMLLSAGIPLPKHVFAHGFFTINGQKMSKTIGNVIDPLDVVKEYGRDALRYFVLREIRFGADGDFSERRLKQRYEADLAKGLGNFVSRVITMAENMNWSACTISPQEGDGLDASESVQNAWQTWEDSFKNYDFTAGLEAIWEVMSWGDCYIDMKKPWALAKQNPSEAREVLALLLELVRQIAGMTHPFLPDTSRAILSSLGLKEEIFQTMPLNRYQVWQGIALGNLHKGEALFPQKN